VNNLVILEDDSFLVQQCYDCPIPGYLIVIPQTPLLSLAEMTRETSSLLGRTLGLATQAIEAVIGPERTYAACFGEEVNSIHFHLFPRTKWLLEQYRQARELPPGPISGPQIFDWARETFRHGSQKTIPGPSLEDAVHAMRRIVNQMKDKDTVRTQFNVQAEKFSSWVGTRDQGILQELFDFVGFSDDDELLDVACGSGEFALYCADRIRRVCGVDISERMIELATGSAAALGLNNLFFECHDVEKLPFTTGSFSVVTSRSAFHHMENYVRIFSEMVRCCRGNGLICIDDLAAHEDPHVNTFIDELDTAIDVSHNARISKESLREIFTENGVEIVNISEMEYELALKLYVSHACQTKDAGKRIDELVEYGLKDPEISRFLYIKDGKPVFKNRCVRLRRRKGGQT